MNNNEDLLEELGDTDGLLDSAHDFTSECTIQSCEKSGAADRAYSVNVMETRAYDSEAWGKREYAHTFSVVINSPTDYYVSGVDSDNNTL